MILVTGGSGYIGSHFIIKLLMKGINVISIDNFSNSSPIINKKIREITGRDFQFYECDLKASDTLEKIFNQSNITSVAHFAGFKSIQESINSPIDYFSNNINSTTALLKAMQKSNVNQILFSSSATVYGNNHQLPWREDLSLIAPDNAYAQSKFINEELIKTVSNVYPRWSSAILRYFNPIGFHESGIIGDTYNDKSKNLIPEIIRVISGEKEYLDLYGNNFNTNDGTGIRDYIHIDDLIDGHFRALEFININKGYHVWNLGRGKGYSVLEIVKIFEEKLKKKIPYQIKTKREGDLAEYWADVSKAKIQLGWEAKKNISEMVESVLRYVKNLEMNN